jgi:tetratricopeptide (TPR) repeat protein
VANSVRNWIAIAHIWQGQWDAAQQVAADSVRVAESSGALLLLAVSRSVAGWAAWGGRGELEGLEQVREALRWMQRRRGRFYTSLQQGWLVEGCLEQGLLAAARDHAAQALWRVRSGERLGEAVACRALAVAAAQGGRPTEAARLLARAERSARLRDSPREQAHNLVARARIARGQGHHAAAQEALTAALDLLRALRMPWHAQQSEAWARGLSP